MTLKERQAYRKGYLKGLKEHTVPFTELNDYTKEMIEEAAKDDYSMNHKDSATDLIDWLYKDDDISPELARKAYDYYCDVYSELQSHSEDDDYFDDEWEETDDPLYDYEEDDEQEEKAINDPNRYDIPRFYDESKNRNRKSIKEANDTYAYPYDAFDYPLQFVGNLNKFLPSGVTAKIGDKIKATPYNGKGFKVEVEDDQSSDKLSKVFEIHFTYESDVDEIQVAAIFKPHRDANVIQTWITRDTTWEELSDELASKIWGKIE